MSNTNKSLQAKLEALRAENCELRKALDATREQQEFERLNAKVQNRTDVETSVREALAHHDRVMERREMRQIRARQALIILAAALVTVLAAAAVLHSHNLVSVGTARYAVTTATVGIAFAAGLYWPAAWPKHK